MAKKSKEQLRLEMLQRRREIKRKVFAEFWLEFTKNFRPWLHELTRRYKERGDFPLMAAWLLPSYYTDTKDIEIAAFAALLIKEDDKVLQRVEAFRQMLGEHPYEWFEGRGFVSLSIGHTQLKRTAGVLNSKIAEYFNDIYGEGDNIINTISIVLIKHFGQDRYWSKLNMLRLVLGGSDGFGKYVWTIMLQDFHSPLTGDVMALLKTFMPDYVKLHNIDDAIHLFGFENDGDFFYAALAYKELRERNPKGCSRLATVFQKRYREGNQLSFRYWGGSEGILPEIDL